MALRMNTTFRKVLQKVLIGLLITEPNVKRGNKRIKRRCLEMKRVLRRSRFAFRCHAQSMRERERERERERGRETENIITTQHRKIEKK